MEINLLYNVTDCCFFWREKIYMYIFFFLVCSQSKKDSPRSMKYIYIYIYIYIYHHHVVLVGRISLTLSRHFSLSFISSGRSSGQHPVSSHSCWMYVRVGRPAFARPCVGVHKSTSLMSSSLQVAVQLVSCGVLPPGLVQDCSLHSCVIAI